MKKVNIKLTSGNVDVKPLINAFESENNKYVVFDQEQNGSMGLPIILVCKIDNNRLTKIADANEWAAVKECLKKIIANKEITFINVEDEIEADDVYFTQLTLPIPSFEALKNAYKVETVNETAEISAPTFENSDVESTPVEETASVADNVVEQPISNETVENEDSEEAVNLSVEESDSPAVNDTNNSELDFPSFESLIKSLESAIDEDDDEDELPTNDELFHKYAVKDEEVATENVVEEAPTEEVTPVIEETTTDATPVINVDIVGVTDKADEEDIFAEQKQAFMKACENMFDALAAKFKKEMSDKKN